MTQASEAPYFKSRISVHHGTSAWPVRLTLLGEVKPSEKEKPRPGRRESANAERERAKRQRDAGQQHQLIPRAN